MKQLCYSPFSDSHIVFVFILDCSMMKNTYRGCNKHFAFVEYRDHDRAKYSKEKMSDPTFKLDGNAPTVTYYNPSASQVLQCLFDYF